VNKKRKSFLEIRDCKVEIGGEDTLSQKETRDVPIGHSCIFVNNRYQICILPSKDFGRRDIILIDYKERQARSVRSTTELANILLKRGIDKDDLSRVMSFIGERLRSLDELYAKYRIETPLGGGGYTIRKKVKSDIN